MGKATMRWLWGAGGVLFMLLLSLHWRISDGNEKTGAGLAKIDTAVVSMKAVADNNAQRIVDLRTDLRQLAQQVSEHDRGPARNLTR